MQMAGDAPVGVMSDEAFALAQLPSIPTTTAHQARLQLYQPTRRPQWQKRVIDTPWGKATVRGKLGQVHADIIEAICRHAEDYRLIPETGSLQILVDPYRVRVTVGGGKPYAKDTMWSMLQELRETSILLEVPTKELKVLGGILDRVEESPATRMNRLTGKERALWRVTLNHAFTALLQADLHLTYDPAPLAKIETGVAQAIARHILTHKTQPQGGWMLDSMIDLVGAGGTSVDMRNRRRDVRKCVASLRAVGIVLEGTRLTRAMAEV